MAPKRIWDGVRARVVGGERQTLAVVELGPGAVVPEHAHEHEQLGLVIEGSVRFTVGGETEELEAGGTWRIPSKVPHTVAAGPEGAVVVDVFAPARADWDEIPDEPARAPDWPK